MTHNSSTYSIVNNNDDDGALTFERLYSGVNSIRFLAVIKEGDAPVVKVQTGRMLMKPIVESAVCWNVISNTCLEWYAFTI